jgi:D-sedoheptulose 7-phosphate isomerase
LDNLVRPGDVVIAISASGNSPNILAGVERANRAQARTIGFTGFNGGKLGFMVDLHIHVPSQSIEHVEDIHLMIEHMVCKTLRENAKEQVFSRPALLPISESEPPDDGSLFSRLSLDFLNALSREIDSVEDPAARIQRVLALTLEGVGASSGSFVVFDENGRVQQAILAYAGRIAWRASQAFSDVIERGLARWVIENRQAALVSSTRDDPRWLPRDWERDNGSSRSAVSVPVLDHDRVLGVLTLVHPQEGKFTPEHMFLLTSIALFLSVKRARTLIRETKP